MNPGVVETCRAVSPAAVAEVGGMGCMVASVVAAEAEEVWYRAACTAQNSFFKEE